MRVCLWWHVLVMCALRATLNKVNTTLNASQLSLRPMIECNLWKLTERRVKCRQRSADHQLSDETEVSCGHSRDFSLLKIACYLNWTTDCLCWPPNRRSDNVLQLIFNDITATESGNRISVPSEARPTNRRPTWTRNRSDHSFDWHGKPFIHLIVRWK